MVTLGYTTSSLAAQTLSIPVTRPQFTTFLDACVSGIMQLREILIPTVQKIRICSHNCCWAVLFLQTLVVHKIFFKYTFKLEENLHF